MLNTFRPGSQMRQMRTGLPFTSIGDRIAPLETEILINTRTGTDVSRRRFVAECRYTRLQESYRAEIYDG